MTSDLSHELRTPLATIQSRVEALEDGVLPPTPENLRVIGEEVERLGRLLGALRSLNELESEDLSVRARAARPGRGGGRRRRPPRAAFPPRASSSRRAGAGRGQATATGCCRSPPTCSTTRSSSRRRAASRGRRAWTPSRRPATAAAAPRSPGRRAAAVRLTVTDDGPGIDPADLPFIFDRFYRAQAARGTQGAGLGLAICRALVEAQGGTIEAAEAPGGGAVFTVRLPLLAAGESRRRAASVVGSEERTAG